MSSLFEFVQTIGVMIFGIVTAVVAIAVMILLMASPFIAIGAGIAVGLRLIGG